jgi:hypothetical protein
MSPAVINPESLSGNSYVPPGLTLKISTFCQHIVCRSVLFMHVCMYVCVFIFLYESQNKQKLRASTPLTDWFL